MCFFCFQMPQSKIIYESIIYICLLLILVAQLVLGNPIQLDDEVPEQNKRSRDKRSFYHIHCKGIYDKSIFARVDQICEDCYNLFREQKLHTLCRYVSFKILIFSRLERHLRTNGNCDIGEI